MNSTNSISAGTLKWNHGHAFHFGLFDALTGGLDAPLNRDETLAALRARGGVGLVDRLIAIDYAKAGQGAITLDRRMARLKGARLL